MIKRRYSKLIVKDELGNLVHLLPEVYTESSAVASSTEPIANSAAVATISALNSKANVHPIVKVMEEEPTIQNLSSLPINSLVAWIQPDSWQFTIEIDSNYMETEVPFSLYGTQDATIVVHWGDGTSTTHTSNEASADIFPHHSYDAPGEYSIKIESNDFERIYIDTFCGDWEDYWYYGSRTFSLALKSIDSPLPKLAGVIGKWNYNVEPECIPNSFEYLFNYFNNLVSIPKDLFKHNSHITNFGGCFNYCTSLASIPAGLFDSNTAATNFYGCFYNCSSLQSIPEGLFDKNMAVTSFANCFRYCSSLNDFSLHIGSSLVSNCNDFVNKKTGTTRTIYVPSGSTTQTTFNARASTLGLTIIGE